MTFSVKRALEQPTSSSGEFKTPTPSLPTFILPRRMSSKIARGRKGGSIVSVTGNVEVPTLSMDESIL